MTQSDEEPDSVYDTQLGHDKSNLGENTAGIISPLLEKEKFLESSHKALKEKLA